MVFKGDGFAAPGGAHPFDGDRAAAGTDIPEQLIGGGCQRGKGGGADFAFGELAIMDKGVIGKACKARPDFCICSGHTFHGQRIEIGEGFGWQGVGDETGLCFARAAHVFQNGDMCFSQSRAPPDAAPLREWCWRRR